MGKKIIIVGGGVAGLSAGIYARMNGFDTEIIEMHTKTGGQCTAWDRKGYRFDYCLHWLVGTKNGPFHDIWEETGAIDDSVKIIDHQIHTRAFSADGEEFIIYTNLDRWEEYLCEIAPEDKAGIRKMCNYMRRSSVLQPYSDPPGMGSFTSRFISYLKMLPIVPVFLKYGRKSSDDYFRDLNFKNPDLRFFLRSIYGDNDFSALAFIMMFAWFNQQNAGYLAGGSLPLAQRMTRRFCDLGGKLTTGKRVGRIIIENDTARGVLLSDGQEIRSDYVISAADGHATIFDLLEGRYLTRKITEAYKNWKLFTPIVQVSFGINQILESDAPVESWLHAGQKIGSTITRTGYSIMNYSFDPTMAPEGKSVIVLRYESPWELWSAMDEEAYRKEKALIEKDATELLGKRYPGILGSVEVCDVATPLTDVRYTGVWKGSYEGFLPASKNLMANIEPSIPGLKNFYMAGQWLFPGGGLPPAGQSGKWAVRYICREEKMKFRVTA